MMADNVFQEPWEAQAFALATALQQRGLIAPQEWAQALGQEIAASAERGEPDDGTHHYFCVLAALETILAQKGLISPAQLATRKTEWEAAARRTLHGQPIELGR